MVSSSVASGVAWRRILTLRIVGDRSLCTLLPSTLALLDLNARTALLPLLARLSPLRTLTGLATLLALLPPLLCRKLGLGRWFMMLVSGADSHVGAGEGTAEGAAGGGCMTCATKSSRSSISYVQIMNNAIKTTFEWKTDG